MLHIGLTGGIATGKTTVAQMFAENGAKIIDLDDIAHRAILKGKPGYHELIDAFGNKILDENGQINRQKLGEIAFGDREHLRTIEEIIHPAVLQEWQDELQELKASNAKIVISEIPLLFEKRLGKHFDAVVVVYASKEIQIKRLLEREPLKLEAIKRRLDSQIPIDEKVKYADYVIYNEGTLEKTRSQVESVWKELLELANKKGRAQKNLHVSDL